MTAPAEQELRPERIGLVVTPVVGIVLASSLTGGTGAVMAHAAVGVATLALCMLVGASLLRWLRLPGLTLVERSVLAAAAGAGILALAFFALGTVGWLRPVAVVGVAVGTASAAALHTRPWRYVERAWVELEELFEGPLGLVLLAAFALALGLLLTVSVLPTWDWDTMMYHLPVPQRFLEEGTILGPPVIAHYGFVGAVHMLYLVPIALGTPQAAAVVSGGFAFLLATFVFSICRRELGSLPAALAVAGIAGSTIIAFVAITPRVDVTLALFLLLTHYCVLKAAHNVSPRYLVAAGLLGGVALATKIHAGAYLLPLAVWVLWLLVRRRIQGRHLTMALTAGAVVALPWLLRNWFLFGDPLFPLLGRSDIPPWLLSYEGLVEAAAATGSVLGALRDPVSIEALILNPGSLSPEPEAHYYLWSPLLLAGAILVVLYPRAWRWGLPPVAYVVVALSHSLRTNLRYLIPMIPAFSIAAAASIEGALHRWPRARRWSLGVLIVASLAPVVVPATQVWHWVRDPIESGRYGTIYAAAAVASELVPPDGSILMLYEARTLPFDRRTIPDTHLSTWPLLHASGQAEICLRDLPVTHVLIGIGAVGFYRDRLGEMQFVTDGSLERFIQRCLVEEDRRGGHALFRIQRDMAPPGG